MYEDVACSGQRERIGQRRESNREDKETVSIASMLRLVKVALEGRSGEAEKDKLKESGNGELECSEMSQR